VMMMMVIVMVMMMVMMMMMMVQQSSVASIISFSDKVSAAIQRIADCRQQDIENR
jgi:hypothetical protein